MKKAINELRQTFNLELKNIQTTAALEAIKVKFLGKKGPIQQLMKDLRDVSQEDRPRVGKEINDFKEEITKNISDREIELISVEQEKQLSSEAIDITLPGRRRFPGGKHIVTQTMDEIIDILSNMGFSVQYGPDIETDYYNFEALNFSEDHPARDMQDTFYVADKVLLRTHTSNVQVRIMEQNKPPIRIIAPGKVYRNEAISARSHVFFHQVEGFYIDKGVTFSDLLGTLNEFLNKLFGQKVEILVRPSYFPFVEPGIEVDVSCVMCQAKGCNLCKHTGWLEILGAGMIHPEVLKNGGIDPEVYSGYAWGMGVDRLAMLKYGITDIRLLTENDTRFLSQFASVK